MHSWFSFIPFHTKEYVSTITENIDSTVQKTAQNREKNTNVDYSLGLRLRPTFEKLFTRAKVVYEIDPRPFLNAAPFLFLDNRDRSRS